MKTAVVILNYNGKHYLQKFLPYVIRFTPNARIVVADNASSDGSVEMLKASFPEVELIVLDKNYGFAEGYNIALKDIDSEYFVLLNSDVEVTDKWLEPMEAYLDTHETVVAIQPKILSQTDRSYFEYAGACGGFIDKFGYPFCRGRVLNTIEKDERQYDDIADILWASGACMMIRTEKYFEVGGLDSRFFAYQEEIDLCLRLKARGYQIKCVPQSVVFHVGSGVLGADSPFKTYLNFRNNLTMLYKNIPSTQLRYIFFVRWWLDYLAAFQMLLSGKWRNAKSVWRARRDFCRSKHQFLTERQLNLTARKINDKEYLNNIFLLPKYYIKGLKTYDKLHRK